MTLAGLEVVRCAACGGVLEMRAGDRSPRCLFCGATKLVAAPDVAETLEPARSAVPFTITEADARAAFHRFARSSVFHPAELRSTRLQLRALHVPAWVWSARLETHHAGLVKASTKSGKSPITGSQELTLDEVLVPASTALSRAELEALAPFEASARRPLDDETSGIPRELPLLTRSIATAHARAVMQQRVVAELGAGLLKGSLKVASLAHDLAGEPVLLPLYVGAYRHGGRPYRVLVNGRTGRLVGTAPLSAWRIAAVVVAGLALLVVAWNLLRML